MRSRPRHGHLRAAGDVGRAALGDTGQYGARVRRRRERLLVDCPGGAYAKLSARRRARVADAPAADPHRETPHPRPARPAAESVARRSHHALPILGLRKCRRSSTAPWTPSLPSGTVSLSPCPADPVAHAERRAGRRDADFRVWTTPPRTLCRRSRYASRPVRAPRPWTTQRYGALSAVEHLAAGAVLLVHEATFAADQCADARGLATARRSTRPTSRAPRARWLSGSCTIRRPRTPICWPARRRPRRCSARTRTCRAPDALRLLAIQAPVAYPLRPHAVYTVSVPAGAAARGRSP